MTECWPLLDDIALDLGITKHTVYLSITKKEMAVDRGARLWRLETSEIDNWVRSGDASRKVEPGSFATGEVR